MFPIGDSPNPRGIAWVNLLLIAANVLVYVLLMPQMGTAADPTDPRYVEYIRVLQQEGRLEGIDPRELEGQITEYDLLVYEHGSKPAAWTWLSMLTSMFLHGGFMHLFGNMLFLWIYGNNVEHRLGSLGYLVAYLATGFAASFGDIALRPDSMIPGVGASGAISGVLGFYFVWFPRNTVRLLILLPPVVRRVDVGARLVLGFYIVVQNIVPALMGGGGGVAYGAHIGGFVAGAVLAFVLSRVQRRTPAEDEDVPPAPRSWLEAADGHEREGEDRAALAGFERAARLAPPGRQRVDAHLGAARVLLDDMDQPTLAYQHLVRAMQSRPTEAQIKEGQHLYDRLRRRVGTVPRRAL